MGESEYWNLDEMELKNIARNNHTVMLMKIKISVEIINHWLNASSKYK